MAVAKNEFLYDSFSHKDEVKVLLKDKIHDFQLESTEGPRKCQYLAYHALVGVLEPKATWICGAPSQATPGVRLADKLMKLLSWDAVWKALERINVR